MNQQQINDAIAAAFNNLAELNEQVYDYWISELYDHNEDFGAMIEHRWNEETLREMEKDVMYNS